MTNVNELFREHVTLEVDCLDRIYLNGYVPTLQTGGQLVNFLTKHSGNRIPSPALFGMACKVAATPSATLVSTRD